MDLQKRKEGGLFQKHPTPFVDKEPYGKHQRNKALRVAGSQPPDAVVIHQKSSIIDAPPALDGRNTIKKPMITNDPPVGEHPAPDLKPFSSPAAWHPSHNTIVAGVLIWAAISAGLFGLKLLMENRPEFVGQPTLGPKAELIQESPSVVTRRTSDDVSVVKPMQPEYSEINFDMSGRRDYRGWNILCMILISCHAKSAAILRKKRPSL